MNDKIKELVKQAIVDVKDEFGNWIGSDFDKEKFAELIVRECCDIFVELRTRPADLAVKDVKKHFGVEE
jgi:hypothetical protein